MKYIDRFTGFFWKIAAFLGTGLVLKEFLMANLFDPVRLGDLQLPNRIIMAPLTRSRAGDERVPNTMMRDYYVQRASAGLILSEATCISPVAVGYAATPGIWSEAQVEGWRMITDAVHAAGGRMFLQLWHVGRVSDPVFLNGETPVAPSAIAVPGHVRLVRPERPYVVPRVLSVAEIQATMGDYKRAAENAKRAGFDGVEIHGANGYLPNQFLCDGTNHREDEYGGSMANRARFLLQVVDVAIEVWGAGRVGVHLSPRNSAGVEDSNPLAIYSYVADELRKRKIAFIFLREHLGEGRIGPQLKRIFGGHVIVNEGMTFESAEGVLAAGDADSASFGKLYISNPDLVERFRRGLPLQPYDTSTFYTPGPKGYVDYPAS